MWQSKLRVISVAAGTLFLTVCAAPAKGPSARGILVRREYVPDDATNTDKVYEWMSDNDIDEEKLVFYTKPEGEAMAKAFVDSQDDGFGYYGSIFGTTFISDFGEVDITNEDVALTLSTTLAEYASGTVRVFNNEPEGGNGHYWAIELEELQKNDDVEWIYVMHDDAGDPEDYGDVLKGLEEEEDSDSDSDDEDAEGEDDDGIF